MRGLTWRDNVGIRTNPPRSVVADLDTLPLPAFEAYDTSRGALYLDVGRGCPYACQFCATAPFWQRAYRMKSYGRILEEMRLVRDRFGRTHANFSHDIFTFRADWTREFCRRLASERLGMTWTCSTRTDIMELDLLPLMADAGCVEIYYGIESGSPRIQREIHKGLDLEWSRAVVEATGRAGIRAITGFIVGYPMETPETLNETLTRYFDFLQVGRGRSHLFVLCPFHESPMFPRYGATASRAAEYLDFPLMPGPAGRADELEASYPGVFVSNRRYETPGVPPAWVDASEELSASLVVLKNLWPLVLPLYPLPLDFYTRWASWIAGENRRRRPGSRLRHQGDASDLLRFVTEEADRMGLGPCLLRDLVRYEQYKLNALTLPLAPSAPARTEAPVGLDTIVARRGTMLFAQFERDMHGPLMGISAGDADARAPDRWVVFARTAPDEITTLQIGPLSKRLLDRSGRAMRVAELIALDESRPPQAGASEPDVVLPLVQQLINHRLLVEASVA